MVYVCSQWTDSVRRGNNTNVIFGYPFLTGKSFNNLLSLFYDIWEFQRYIPLVFIISFLSCHSKGEQMNIHSSS